MSEERFRIEGIPGGDSLHVIHENLELSDTDGLVLVSWTVNFPNPVMGSVDLLQVEAARRVAAAVAAYVKAMEGGLTAAHLPRSPGSAAP
jgi:hypothetical protein